MEAELVEAGPEEAETEAASTLGGEEALRVACSKQMALLALMERTGYSMVQENGQRKYGGPPPGWEGPPPPRGCEVFVGKIPRDMFEDELVPIFQRAGAIYELRLMMEFSGENRGYAFVMFTSRESARRAIQTLDNQQVRPGKFIGVCSSRDNCRLFIGSIPNDKSRQEIQDEVSKVTEGVADVIVYQSAMDRSRNRGFAFVEYESHKAAAMARKKLIPGNLQLWGQTVQVDWAEPEKDVDEEIMQRVKVLFVRNFSPLSSEERLHREFSRCRPGSVERVKMMHSYAFVHFRSREDALAALCLMDGARVDGAVLEVSLARPAWVKERGAARKRSSAGREGETLIDDEGAALMAGLGDSPSPPPPPLLPPPTARGPVFKGGSDVFPLGPGTPLAPAGLLSVRHTQMRSAVSVLDLYCSIKYGAPPTYLLLATPTRHRSPLLVYKVCIPQTGSAFMPDRLCLMLEDAKELAAQTALRSLDWYL